MDDYERCTSQHKCAHDGQDVRKLDDKTRKRVMECRIKRHMECSKPPEQLSDVVIDPVLIYLKEMGFKDESSVN